MPSSSEIQLPELESNDGLPPQPDMVSTREDEGPSVTSPHPQENVLHYQGNTDNSSKTQSSDGSHIIEVKSTEGDECFIASAQSQQNSISRQESGNMENSQKIQPPSSNIQQISSPQDPQPYCREGLSQSVSVEDRKKYLYLYKAAKDGKWKAANKFLDDDSNLLRADLTNRKETILHVATQANQTKFVRKLLNYLDEHEKSDYLESKDVNENTAFLFAVANGNLEMVDLMGRINPNLRTRKGHDGELTPLHIAALQGKSEMAWHLFKNTGESAYGDKSLLNICVNAGIYDLALDLLMKRPDMAFEEDQSKESVLHILSRRPLGLKETQQHELVIYLWNGIFLSLPHEEIMEKISKPSHVVFNAVEVGNLKFLEILISTYPYLIWEVDERGRSIIHIAVLNRQTEIFNFALDIGSIKHIIVNYTDNERSSLLHMAATLQPEYQPSLVLGAAFQMAFELLWFEAVKKIVGPSCIEMKNKAGYTPQEIFTKAHKELHGEAKSWIEKTTNFCVVVTTLVTTAVFSATFSLPGGFNDKTGSPNYLLVDEKKGFVIFSIFDTIALISSSTSIFIFHSILISRHAEYDFQFKSLPIKLIFGLITLLISIISMTISFSCAFIMYFNTKTQSHDSRHNDLEWIPFFICVLAFIPIPIFVYLIWPVWRDLVKLTKFSWNLSQPRKNKLSWKKRSCWWIFSRNVASSNLLLTHQY